MNKTFITTALLVTTMYSSVAIADTNSSDILYARLSSLTSRVAGNESWVSDKVKAKQRGNSDQKQNDNQSNSAVISTESQIPVIFKSPFNEKIQLKIPAFMGEPEPLKREHSGQNKLLSSEKEEQANTRDSSLGAPSDRRKSSLDDLYITNLNNTLYNQDEDEESDMLLKNLKEDGEEIYSHDLYRSNQLFSRDVASTEATDQHTKVSSFISASEKEEVISPIEAPIGHMSVAPWAVFSPTIIDDRQISEPTPTDMVVDVLSPTPTHLINEKTTSAKAFSPAAEPILEEVGSLPPPPPALLPPPPPPLGGLFSSKGKQVKQQAKPMSMGDLLKSINGAKLRTVGQTDKANNEEDHQSLLAQAIKRRAQKKVDFSHLEKRLERPEVNDAENSTGIFREIHTFNRNKLNRVLPNTQQGLHPFQRVQLRKTGKALGTDHVESLAKAEEEVIPSTAKGKEEVLPEVNKTGSVTTSQSEVPPKVEEEIIPSTAKGKEEVLPEVNKTGSVTTSQSEVPPQKNLFTALVNDHRLKPPSLEKRIQDILEELNDHKDFFNYGDDQFDTIRSLISSTDKKKPIDWFEEQIEIAKDFRSGNTWDEVESYKAGAFLAKVHKQFEEEEEEEDVRQQQTPTKTVGKLKGLEVPEGGSLFDAIRARRNPSLENVVESTVVKKQEEPEPYVPPETQRPVFTQNPEENLHADFLKRALNKRFQATHDSDSEEDEDDDF